MLGNRVNLSAFSSCKKWPDLKRPLSCSAWDLAWWIIVVAVYEENNELLELTDFLSPTDLPWRDLVPPDGCT